MKLILSLALLASLAGCETMHQNDYSTLTQDQKIQLYQAMSNRPMQSTNVQPYFIPQQQYQAPVRPITCHQVRMGYSVITQCN